MDQNLQYFKKGSIEKYFPIFAVLLYLSITIILFTYGPYNYPVKYPLRFYAFLIGVNVMLLLGYMYGINRKEKVVESNTGFKLVKVAIIVQLVFIPFTNFLYTGGFLYNFNSIANLGDAYINSILVRQDRSASTVIAYLRAIFSPILICFLPLGFLYWKKLKGKYKVLFLIGVLGGLGIDFFRGTNKGLADSLIVFFIMFVVASIFSSRVPKRSLLIPSKNRNINLTILIKILMTLVIITFLFFLFFLFFSSTVPNRYGVSFYAPNGQYTLNINNPILSIFPNYDMKLAFGAFIHYFTQGYYALGLSMEKPFMPTFGLGSSMVVLLNINSLFNTNILFERTYVYRNTIENGWDWHGQWSSFYVWMASDISFVGILPLMFFLGYVIARCWSRMINCNDYISTVVFIQMIILCFYLPANNQLFQSLEGLIGNGFWLIFWIFSIKNRKGTGKTI